MSFFGGMKRVFGFSGDTYIEEDEELRDEEMHEEVSVRREDTISVNEDSAAVNGTAPDQGEPESESNIPEESLQKIIDMMNSVLPEYARKFIDLDAQKRFVMDALGDSFANASREIADRAYRRGMQKAGEELDAANKEIDVLKAASTDAENKIKELNDKYTQAESQRKLMRQKAQDLEMKVQTSEAEMEQYQLENKSLLNKIKVMGVKADDVQYFKDENDRLLAEITKQKNALVEANSKAEVVSRELDAERKQKAELEKKLAEAMDEISRLAIVSESTAETDSEELAELHEKFSLANSRISELEERLKEANESLEVVESIQEQLTQVEEFKQKKNEKIEKLNNIITQRDNEIRRLVEKVDTLNNTIDDERRMHEEKVKQLTNRIKSAEALADNSPKARSMKTPSSVNFDLTDSVEKEKIASQDVAAHIAEDNSFDLTSTVAAEGSTVEFSAIDFADDNWLRPTPPTEIVAAEPVVEETPPKASIVPEVSDLQLSLF